MTLGQNYDKPLCHKQSLSELKHLVFLYKKDMDRARLHRHIDRKMDGRTDGQGDSYITPKLCLQRV